MNRKRLLISIILVSIGTLLVLLSSTSFSKETFYIKNIDREDLYVEYYEGNDDLIILCNGFSSDTTQSKRLALILNKQGYSVVSFDFTGHGKSDGTIGFDNAQTDRLSKDIDSIVKYFNIVEGYRLNRMILVGHSMGARSIMQYATNVVPYRGIVLVGPEINLQENTQASFFTGAVDTEMPFVERINANNPNTAVLIITSNLDDISPPENAELLHEKLIGDGTGIMYRGLVEVKNVLHNYEFFSGKVIKEISWFASNVTGNDNEEIDILVFQHIYVWIIGVLLIVIAPFISYSAFDKKQENHVENLPNKYYYKLIGKWALSLILLAVFAGIMFVLPLRKPFFSVQYVFIVGGYGVISILFNIKKKEFSLIEDIRLIKQLDKITILRTILIIFIFTIVSYIVRYSSINMVFTNIEMGIWYLIFILLMSLGFYVLGKETDHVLSNTHNTKKIIIFNIVKYMPFYIFLVFYLVLGSLSGITTSLQGIIILFYAIYVSKLVKNISKNDVISAITIAIIIAIPFGALF